MGERVWVKATVKYNSKGEEVIVNQPSGQLAYFLYRSNHVTGQFVA